MEKILSTFQDLTNDQLYDLLKLRQDVFVIEQDCIYQDFDGYDKQATHFLIYEHKKLVAYSRIFAPSIKYDSESSIGRIIVSKPFRGGDFGKTLIRESITYCLKHFRNTNIRIEAQSKLLIYYKNLGFIKDSDSYKVDGIDHLQMIYRFIK